MESSTVTMIFRGRAARKAQRPMTRELVNSSVLLKNSSENDRRKIYYTQASERGHRIFFPFHGGDLSSAFPFHNSPTRCTRHACDPVLVSVTRSVSRINHDYVPVTGH